MTSGTPAKEVHMRGMSGSWQRIWGTRTGAVRRPPSIIGQKRLPEASLPGAQVRGHVTEALPPAGAEHARAPFPIALVTDRDVDEDTREHAREALVQAAKFACRPVIKGRLSIRRLPDPSLERPVAVRATLDVSGKPIRAHVTASTVDEAIDLVEARLRRNLDQVEALRRAGRHDTGVAAPGEWRHGDLPAQEPRSATEPIEEGELVRHATLALPAGPRDAASDLEALGLDFHLFTNLDTGEENLVYRRPDGAVALVQPAGAAESLSPIPVDPAPAPLMLLHDAVERLNASGEQFVFFVEAQTGRGNVVYRQADGRYGLVEPIGEQALTG